MTGIDNTGLVRQVAQAGVWMSMPDRVLSGPKNPCALPCNQGCCKRPICQSIYHGPNPGIVRCAHQISDCCQVAPLHTHIHITWMADRTCLSLRHATSRSARRF